MKKSNQLKSILVAGAIFAASSAFALSNVEEALVFQAKGDSKKVVKNLMVEKAQQYAKAANSYEKKSFAQGSAKGVIQQKNAAEAAEIAKALNKKAAAYKKAAESL